MSAELNSPVNIKNVIIESPRNSMKIDIAPSVTDITIYEHLDKPYLTGAVMFTDHYDVVGGLDIGGGEALMIKLGPTNNDEVVFTKHFYVDKIVSAAKPTSDNELFVLHIIEDHAYKSNLQNVNRSYAGKTYDIMSKISSNYLGKQVDDLGKHFNNTRVIIPNLTPLDAMCWLKNRTTTKDGYPTYLFSYFGGDNLAYIDLKTMMEQPAINPVPYVHGEANATSIDPDTENSLPGRRSILSYDFSSTENLFQLIAKGLIGAKHNYIDITSDTVHEVDFDAQADVVDKIVGDFNLKGSPLYSDLFKLNGKPFNKVKSRTLSQLTSTMAYDDNLSYLESDTVAQYKLNSINEAMDGLLKKAPLTIAVQGLDFIQEEGHYTVGNKLDIRFQRNVDHAEVEQPWDLKKSGHFLVYAAKHAFSIDSYIITMSCVKLSNDEVVE